MGDDEVRAIAEAFLEGASAAGVGLALTFADGSGPRTVYANDAATQILGWDASELVGASPTTAFTPDDQQRLRELTASTDAVPSPIEMTALRKDGGHVPVELTLSVVSLHGEPATVIFIRDIRERRAADEAMRRSERRFRQLIEAAPDAIAVHRDGRFLYVNPAHEALLGRPLEELVDREVTTFIHPDDRMDVERGLAAGPQREAREYRVVRPDGQVVSVEISSLPIEYEGAPATLSFARDTTERKLMQAALAFADRMTTLGTLAAGVAHEINNPLAYVAMNVENLARKLPRGTDGSVERSLEAARDGLAHVAKIVRDLRTFSTPRSEIRWPVVVEEILESAVNVAMHEIRGRARIVRRYGRVPPLKTDPARLGQILLNLLFNAVQAFDSVDEETNTVWLDIASSGHAHVVVTVSDNGPGIAPEHIQRIFEPFFTTKGNGTGLGLAICQALVTALGGKLDVDSELGAGTSFTVILPVTS